MQNDVKHWKLTRLLSLPLIPLFLYFVTQAQFIITPSRDIFLTWVRQPSASIALALFIVCGFWHAALGLDEIIIDYVPDSNTQKGFAFLLKAALFALGAACLYAIYAISSGKF